MAIPSQERTTGNYGYAPYQESAFKAALRLLGQGFGAGISGLSAVPQGANFGEAFLASAGASGKSVSAARMAAEEYAMKRQEAERKAQEDEVQSRYMEALTEQAKRPPKPEKPEKIDPWNMTPDEQKRYYDHLEAVERSKARGKPVKAGKPPKPPKPMKFPRRIPSGYTEQDIINSIDQETDPANLVPYISGRGGADSEAIRRAAQLRANDIARQAR